MGKQSREKKERREEREQEPREKFEITTGSSKICLSIIRWGTYLVLFTPLIVHRAFFFPFVAPKTIFFRILVEIILAAYLFLVMANNRYRPRINSLTIAVALFLLVFILASFAGVNLERSFWSTNERMTGIWTMLHLFVFFIILGSTFKHRYDWEKILGVSIIVGVILSLYVLMSDEISSRGGGTIGNTSFMAAYLLFDVFFALSLFLYKKGGWRIFSGASLLIMLPVLLTSTGRGAIVSFFLGLSLLALGFLIFSQRKAFKRLAFGIVLVLMVFGIFSAVFQPAFVKDKVESTLLEMKSRLVVWEKGWQGFLERPVLGWGPENFNNVFLQYFNSCMFLSECGSEIWFDRTHNIVFDTLVTVGLIGFLSYLAVFGVAIFGLLKILPQVAERKNIFLPLGMAVLLAAYFFQNLLVFDMINTYLVFFLSLAFISFLIDRTGEEKEVKARRVNPVVASAIIGATFWILWAGNIQPAMANRYLIYSLQSRYVEESTSYFQKSLRSAMDKYEPREQFTQKIIKSVNQGVPEEIKGALQEAFELAEIEMEKSIKQNYLDFRPHLFLGELYNASYRLSGQAEKLDKAEAILTKAIQLSPTNQQGYWYLADTRLIQGKTEEAISLLQKAVELEPRLGQSHWYLAMTYKNTGQYELAKEEIIKTEGLDYGWQGNLTELKKAIEVYLALGDDAGLIPLYQKAVTLDPTDIQLWASLAASYANLGQFAEAKEAAKKVAEINPDFTTQIEEFLRNLPQ